MLETLRDNFLRPWRLYASFSGRASRAEFWTFTLGCALIGTLLTWVSDLLTLPLIVGDYRALEFLFQLAAFVPSIAVTARRLHDINKSGWWQLIALVPLIGWIVLFIDMVSRPTRGLNRFGSNPYGDPALVMPDDGGPPYASTVGRFIECPYCGQRNPAGRSDCQWCHKTYREQTTTPV